MKSRGQALVGYVITIGLAAVAGMASYFGSINSQDRSIGEVKGEIQVLKNTDGFQNNTIAEMKENIEYIRKVVEEQARRQGIVVKDNQIIYDPYLSR